MVCSACGDERPDGDRYCGMCGTPLPHRPMSTPGAQSTVHLSRGPLNGQGLSAVVQNARVQPSYGDEWTADPPAAETLPSATTVAQEVAAPPGETFEPALVLPEAPGRELETPAFQPGPALSDELPSGIVDDLALPEFSQVRAVATEAPTGHSAVSEFLDELVTEPAEPSASKEPPHFPWMDGVLDQIEFEAAKTPQGGDERPRFMDVLGDLDLPPLETDAPGPGVVPPEPTVVRPPLSESKPAPRVAAAWHVAEEGWKPPVGKRWMWQAAAAALVFLVLGAIQWSAPITRAGKYVVEVVTAKFEDLTGTSAGSPPTPAASSEPNAFSKAVGFEEQSKPPAQNPPAAKAPTTVPSENPQSAGTAAATPVQAPPPAPSAARTPASYKAGEVAQLWKATARGDPNAPLQLADIYANGDGVPRSCEQAVVLLKTAALRANPEACNRLATMYADATCVQRDRIEAFRWVRAALAANPESLSAQHNRDRIWEGMTAEERMATQKSQ